ncbi:hypothetical protein TSUD_264880 [Trifolium subterraneum]|uniref:Uncharacterized protein n=1 Tax=Trifolium subterraneum TaxID=3900 RepID=A0A2Z6MWE9_TRISU|nr:hypothetical protein TSUD_264880 [Trifolium subterraneum]
MSRKPSSSKLKGIMNTNEEEILYGNELSLALQENINKIARDFKAKYKGHPEIQQVIPEEKPAKQGRRDTTILIGKETVSFAFPSDFDTSKFKDIDNLEGWTLEYRKRNTGLCDPYFIPATSTSTNPMKFKSVIEVVNYLLPKGYTKLPSRKRKGKRKVKESNKKTCPGSSSVPQEIENSPEEDVSMETLESDSSSSIVEMLNFVPLTDGVMDDICKDIEPVFPLDEGGYDQDAFNDDFNNQWLLHEENYIHEVIAEEVQECDEEIDESECDDWIVS